MSPADLTGVEQTLQGASMPLPAAASESGPSWQEQDSILRELWMRNQPPAAIAKTLGRSIPAIMTRAVRLGLPRRAAPGRKPGRRAPDATTMTRPRTARSDTSMPIGEDAATQLSARICLMCLGKFQSLGRHNRICPGCKNSAEYESGSRLPDLDFPVGDS